MFRFSKTLDCFYLQYINNTRNYVWTLKILK